MSKSIRYKLLVYMTASIIGFALILLVANTFFAEKFYVQHQKGILIETSKEITRMINGLNKASDFLDEDLIFVLNKLEKSSGVSIVIGKVDGTLYYPIIRNTKGQPRKIFDVNPFVNIKKKESRSINVQKDIIKDVFSYDDNSYFVITKDPNLNFNTLRYQARLENDLTILVWIPMAAISESAAVSNKFTAIVTIITILISGLWFLYISDRFTKPIKEINKTAKKMAELDFTQKLDIVSEDEIGQLSKSINDLSYKLDNAIGELNRKNKQLEKDVDMGKKIDTMRKEFVSNVSHELKTPIFIIQGYAEGLKTNIADDEEKKNFYYDVIMEEAEKMDIIVKDLLNLSQIESGDMDLSRCDFDIGKLISETVKKLEPMFEEKGINIELDVDVKEQAYGDPVRIEQIILNYLNNAINHIDSNNQIKVMAKTLNEKIRVSVFNTGKNIPEELLDRIWVSFYKVDKARTRSYGGTGLGLAIVKAIQHAHDNLYGVLNSEDGVLFWFEIDLGDA